MDRELNTTCEAQYSDGYIHSEAERDDASAYQVGKNIFYDIVERLPEEEHGPMTRFSVFCGTMRYDLDWRDVPENATPVRFRHGYAIFHLGTGVVENGWTGVEFGYEFIDDDGQLQQVIINDGT